MKPERDEWRDRGAKGKARNMKRGRVEGGRGGVLSQTYDNETREEERQPSPHPAANSSPELGRTDENIRNDRARSRNKTRSCRSSWAAEKETFSSRRKHFALKLDAKWLIMIINDCSNKPFPDGCTLLTERKDALRFAG